MSSAQSDSLPTRGEIVKLLKEGKGAAYVYSELAKKYGPAKGKYGGFCRQVMLDEKAKSNAIVNGALNGTVASQPNGTASVNASSIPAQSTGNLPVVYVREPDAVIEPHERLPASAMYPDAEDMALLQRYKNYFRRLELQQLSMLQQPQPTPPPSPRNWVEEMNRSMMQTSQLACQLMAICTILRPLLPK